MHSFGLASLPGCWIFGHLLAESFDVFGDRGSKVGGDLREVFSAFFGVNQFRTELLDSVIEPARGCHAYELSSAKLIPPYRYFCTSSRIRQTPLELSPTWLKYGDHPLYFASLRKLLGPKTRLRRGLQSSRMKEIVVLAMPDDSITISPGPKFKTAMLLAIAADVLQLAVFPLFVEGALSPLDDVLDVAVGAAMVQLLGWHWEFLPSFFAKLVPGVDLVPFWTLAVANVYRKAKRMADTGAEKPLLPER